MIARTIDKIIEDTVANRPITFITGARQVGKSTLAFNFIKKGFNYVSFDNSHDLQLAKTQPELFLSLHPAPLIIDEVQRAPELFPALEEKVNMAKLKEGHNYGMYILTGSQMYRMMKYISESLSGRVGLIRMSPLSRNELLGREERPFLFDVEHTYQRSEPPLTMEEVFKHIVRGFYPELVTNPNLNGRHYYADYVDTYIERDVSDLIKVKDKLLFRNFLELLASLTGQELVYDNISKILGIDAKTVKSWVSVLLTGDIIHLLQPYNETSFTKRMVKRSKVYFSDTGLAAYLARLDEPESLMVSAFAGRFYETYVVNEIRKSFLNNGDTNPGLYYYRDSNQNEVDLVLIHQGKIHLGEIKLGMKYTSKDIRSFACLASSHYEPGLGGILCNTDTIYPLGEGHYVYPIAGI